MDLLQCLNNIAVLIIILFSGTLIQRICLWYNSTSVKVEMPKGVRVKRLSSSYFVVTSRKSKTRLEGHGRCRKSMEVDTNNIALQDPVRLRRRKRSGDYEASSKLSVSRSPRLHHRRRTRTKSNKMMESPLPARVMQLRREYIPR